jgi:hypothetical protein
MTPSVHSAYSCKLTASAGTNLVQGLERQCHDRVGLCPEYGVTSMISLKVLSTVAIVALALPLVVTPESSFAQAPPGAAGGGAARGAGGGAPAGGGGGFRGGGGGGGAAIGGGGFRGGGGGGGFRQDGGPPTAAGGGFRAGGLRQDGGPPAGGYRGGGGRGGYAYRGGYRGGYHRGGGGFGSGLVAGAVIGGAYASQYPYGYYGDTGYYDGGDYDDSTVAVVPGGGDDVAYCVQRFRSYDPASGTYLGNDGLRHPCP